MALNNVAVATANASTYLAMPGPHATPPGCEHTEVGLKAEEWRLAPLRTLSDFITKGSTPTTYGFRWQSYGILFLRSECVSSHGLDLGQSMFISSTAHEMLRRSAVRNGDVLITITGNVGRVVLLQGVGQANINQHIARVRILSADVDSRFVYHVLSQVSFRRRFESITTGQAYPQISLRQVRDTPVPLPRLDEQRVIADILSDVDGLLEALDALIAKKRAIKQAAMQQLLTGKTRLPGFTEDWTTKRLEQIASIRNDKVKPSETLPKTPYIELEHIGQGNGRLFGHSDAAATSSLKYRFVADDVLFGRLRPYLRKYWLADFDGICTTEIWPLTVDPGQARSGFLLGVVQSVQFIDAASISYGTHMPRADWSVMRNFEVRVPPVDEQEAISAVLSDIDAEIAALEARRDKTRSIKQGMMQQLLTGRIRLVDPADARKQEVAAPS